MEREIVKVQRWLWALTIAWALSVIVAFGLLSRAEVLQAYRIEVVNGKGKTVAVLGTTPKGDGVLLLYDRAGTLRAAFGMTVTGDATIDLHDALGREQVSLQVGSDGKVKVQGLP